MKTFLTVLLPVLAAAVFDTNILAQSTGGSQLSPEENWCARCHGDATQWGDDTQRFYVPASQLKEDVHRQNGVNCHDCHGGDASVRESGKAHAKVDGFRTSEDVWQACGDCHKEQHFGLSQGVHAKAGIRDARGRGTPLGCDKCHGEKAHGMLAVHDSRAPVFLDNQVRVCGGCHEDDLLTYQLTVHGHGLRESGLVVTAVCADCHGAHGTYYATDARSTLHADNVGATCGKCHEIQELLERSVHGRGYGRERDTEKSSPGGKAKRKPSCTSCHQGHRLLHPELSPFRSEVSNRCGNCHADLSARYMLSLHGQLTELGYGAAAKCSDCHGSHDILPVNDPQSRTAAGKNRLETCRKCHPYVGRNFSDFDPHADYKDAQSYPFLHGVYRGVSTLLSLLFGLFVLHALLWFARSLIHTFQHGRHRVLVPGQFAAFVRFEPVYRILYAVMLVSFLGLAFTGLPLRFSPYPWARLLAGGLGGFESTSVWHHFFAVLAMVSCAIHLTHGATRISKLRWEGTTWKTILFGPDSPVPRFRDARDLYGMLRWFFGLGDKPGFERWTYWEKLDYWAIWFAVALIGTSGLMLWYPAVFCGVLPGHALNVAQMIHSELAIPVASLIFIMHFFNTHFRPEKFPMDLSVLTGLVSEEHLRSARPEYVERMRREGKLESVGARVPSRTRLRFVLLAGATVFLVGLVLLGVILVASLGK